jgi:hypothetical protein
MLPVAFIAHARQAWCWLGFRPCIGSETDTGLLNTMKSGAKGDAGWLSSVGTAIEALQLLRVYPPLLPSPRPPQPPPLSPFPSATTDIAVSVGGMALTYAGLPSLLALLRLPPHEQGIVTPPLPLPLPPSRSPLTVVPRDCGEPLRLLLAVPAPKPPHPPSSPR